MKKIGIIGAGASGLYAAINLKNENTDVTILEKNASIGKKILMTGNGRCNITNAAFYDDFLENIVSNPKFLYSSFNNHDNYASMDFFEKNGLSLITEKNLRVFPKTQKSSDVIKFFENKIIESNIKLVTNAKVKEIYKKDYFIVKESYTENGSILITKNFISGPCVLKISSFLVGKNININEISLDLVSEDYDYIDNLLIKIFDKNPNKDISNVLSEVLTNALVEVILTRSDIKKDKKANQITKDERNKLIENIKNFNLKFDRFAGFNSAVITKGGIEVKEINPKTMESKLVKDLYFIGEVLDIDALTGGFNLQIAFTTAFACASAIKESV